MIDASLAQRALDVFDAALDLPPEDRHRWIDLQCAADRALGDEARLLLSASENVTGILDYDSHRPAVPDLGGAIPNALADRYEIVRELGRGGMAPEQMYTDGGDRPADMRKVLARLAALPRGRRWAMQSRRTQALAGLAAMSMIGAGDGAATRCPTVAARTTAAAPYMGNGDRLSHSHVSSVR